MKLENLFFFESSQYFLRYLTDLFTDLITRLPKQEQLTAKTPMPNEITKKIFWEYFDIQKFIKGNIFECYLYKILSGKKTKENLTIFL